MDPCGPVGRHRLITVYLPGYLGRVRMYQSKNLLERTLETLGCQKLNAMIKHYYYYLYNILNIKVRIIKEMEHTKLYRVNQMIFSC